MLCIGEFFRLDIEGHEDGLIMILCVVVAPAMVGNNASFDYMRTVFKDKNSN